MTERWADRQTGKHRTDRQTDTGQTDRHSRQTDTGQTDRHRTDNCVNRGMREQAVRAQAVINP